MGIGPQFHDRTIRLIITLSYPAPPTLYVIWFGPGRRWRKWARTWTCILPSCTLCYFFSKRRWSRRSINKVNLLPIEPTQLPRSAERSSINNILKHCMKRYQCSLTTKDLSSRYIYNCILWVSIGTQKNTNLQEIKIVDL